MKVSSWLLVSPAIAIGLTSVVVAIVIILFAANFTELMHKNKNTNHNTCSMTKNKDAADVIAASAAPTTLSPTAQQQEQPLQPSLAPQQPQSQQQEAVNNN
jgi:hypothetical protein